MYKINNPIKADILPHVVRLYAEKLNKEYLPIYSESNTLIHLIDSIREAHKNENFFINLNNYFTNEDYCVFKNQVDINIGKLHKLDNEDKNLAENFANYLNIYINDERPTDKMLGRFLNFVFQISFEVTKYNYICLITNKENLDFITEYISKYSYSKEIQISKLQDFDETIIEPSLYDYADNDYSIEIDRCGILPCKLKNDQFLEAYLISNLK